MPEPPGDAQAALQSARSKRNAAHAARVDAQRATARLQGAVDDARAQVRVRASRCRARALIAPLAQVAAELAARAAPLCVPSDLWRVPLPGSEAALSGGDAAAAAAAGRPTPEALWGAAVEGDAARERLSHLLHLCKQARGRRYAPSQLATKHAPRRCTRLRAA